MYDKRRHFTWPEIGEQGELIADGAALNRVDGFSAYISMLETLELPEFRKQDYNGTARLGIKALESKIKGLVIKEIAQMYGVSSFHVGAWTSRSVYKLQEDRKFLDSARQPVEKAAFQP